MALPKINLNDGKHKLIVAEEGERVLTPKQNEEYEATHPNARKKPMLARIGGEKVGLFDATADVSAAPELGMGAPRQVDTIPGDTPDREPKAKRPMGKINFDVQPNENTRSVTSPLLNQEVYDDSGVVKAEPSIADRIKSRAVDLYNQGKALLSPLDNEAEALKPYASTPVAASIAAPAVKPDPAGAYGTRPGEERIDTSKTKPLGMTLNFPFHSAVGSAYDCGGMVEVYDDSGVVDTNKESDDPEKEAAYHQAAAEIHAEEAEKHKASA